MADETPTAEIPAVDPRDAKIAELESANARLGKEKVFLQKSNANLAGLLSQVEARCSTVQSALAAASQLAADTRSVAASVKTVE